MKALGLTLFVVAVFQSKAVKLNKYILEALDGGQYNLMWKYDILIDTFTFNVTFNATGWVAFGVSESFGNMNGYDVIIGGVRGMYMNETYHKDYFTTMRARPAPDDFHNIVLTSAMEMDGYTTLVFYRKRKTGDTEKDVEIKPGRMYLVWAYHYTLDVNATTGNFMQHTPNSRGGMEYTFIDEKYTIVEINDKYRLYWAYDSSNEMFSFTVVVQTAGWIAFGVSTRRGGMIGYDIMVGGVDRRGNGYIADYLTEGRLRPLKDEIQNYNLTAYEERGGYTLLTFHRKRNTGDSNDVEIRPGTMNIVWAYHTADVADDGIFAQHTLRTRGGMEYTFIQGTNGGGDGGDGANGSSSMDEAAKMNEYKMESLDGGDYIVMWKYDMLMDTFTFNVTVNATGWVALGVSENLRNMNGYDVIIGGARGMHMNESYHVDSFTTMRAMPAPDDMQNIMLTSATEMDGHTNLVFYRKRKTGDTERDVEIKPGRMYLVWAYHYTLDVNAITWNFMQHTPNSRAGMEYTFIDEKYTIVEINDKYRLYWAYDSSNEMFSFTVVVQTAGWIAFGVSTRRGGMIGYDTMVGGVDNAGNGYLADYLTGGFTRPPKDEIQNYNLTAYEERGGYTLLTFHRKRDTGDSDDIEIVPGMMNIVWAYHTADVPEGGNFVQHTSQGGMSYTFIQDTNGGGDGGDGNGDGEDGNGDGGDGNGDGGDGNGDGGDGNGDGGDGNGDGGDGNGDGGEGNGDGGDGNGDGGDGNGDGGDGNGDGGDGNGDGGDGNGDGGDGNGDGGDGNGDGENGSSSMYTPSTLGIIALFLFQRVIGA